MSETTAYLRTCHCGTRFEPPLDRRDQTECRKCSGRVCPLCSAPTLQGKVCPLPGCQRVIEKAHKAALHEDRKRARVEPELRLVERRRTA